MENSNDGNRTSLQDDFTFQPGPDQGSSDIQIVVHVIYTSLAGTLAALEAAETLSRQLRARITLLAALPVSYRLPVTRPSVSLQFLERRLVKLAKSRPVQTSIQIYVCRDRANCLIQALSAKSLVVLGTRKRWWPTNDALLARRLQGAGHQMVLVEP